MEMMPDTGCRIERIKKIDKIEIGKQKLIFYDDNSPGR